MRRLLGFMVHFSNQKHLIITHMVLQAIISVLSLGLPQALKLATDAVTEVLSEGGAIGSQGLYRATVLAIISTIALVVANSADSLIEAHMRNKCEQGLQIKLLDKLLSMKRATLNKYSTGDVITKTTQNTPEAVSWTLNAVLGVFQGSCIIVAVMTYMIILDWRLAIIGLIFNILLRSMSDLMMKKIKSSTQEMVNVTKKNNAFLVDVLSNLLTIRSMRKEDYFAGKISDKENETKRTNTLVALWYTYTWYFVIFMGKVSEFGIAYAAGGYLAIKGYVTIGTVISYTLALDMLYKGLNPFLFAFANKSRALPHIESIDNLLEEKELDTEPISDIPYNSFAIRFDKVSFQYSPESPEILKDISFVINPGERVLISGNNGKGKSTILKLMTGLYRPVSGRVLYGDADTTGINIDSMAQKYCYVSQNSNILDIGRNENLAFADEADIELCRKTFEAMGLGGQNESSTLSEGEKQRLNIGRAFYKLEGGGVAFLAGDEIFSNIDKDNREKVSKLISGKFKGKTIIMVCHDLPPFEFDKKIHVSENGVDVTELKEKRANDQADRVLGIC